MNSLDKMEDYDRIAAALDKEKAKNKELRREVAILRDALLSVDDYLTSRGIESRGVTGRTVILPKIRSVIGNTQATAEAYERDVAERALEGVGAMIAVGATINELSDYIMNELRANKVKGG